MKGRGGVAVIGDDPGSAYLASLLSFHFPVYWFLSFSGAPTVEYTVEKEQKAHFPLLPPLSLGATRFLTEPISGAIEVGKLRIALEPDILKFFRSLEGHFPESGVVLTEFYRLLRMRRKRLIEQIPKLSNFFPSAPALASFLPAELQPFFTALTFPFSHLTLDLLSISALSSLQNFSPHFLAMNSFYQQMKGIVLGNGGRVITEAQPEWVRRGFSTYWLSPEGKAERMGALFLGNCPWLWKNASEVESGILPYIVHFTFSSVKMVAPKIFICYPDLDFPPLETRLFLEAVLLADISEAPALFPRGIFAFLCKEFQWKKMREKQKETYRIRAQEEIQKIFGEVRVLGIIDPETYREHPLRFTIPIGCNASIAGRKVSPKLFRWDSLPISARTVIPAGRMTGEMSAWIEEAEKLARRFIKQPLPW